jgi:hypothetical protein
MRTSTSQARFAENRNWPVIKGGKAIAPAAGKGHGDAGAQLNLRNFGNLTAIKEKAGAFFENQGQVSRSLRHISGIPPYGARALAPRHVEANQAGRAAFHQQHAVKAAVH